MEMVPCTLAVELVSVKIRNSDDIKKVSRYLHDATFPKKAIQYHVDKKEFILEATRFMWEKCYSHRVFFFIHRWEASWIRCVLKFKNVLECQIINHDDLEFFEFGGIEIKENDSLLEIFTPYGLAIKIRVNKIDGEFEDIGLPLDKKMRSRIYGFRKISPLEKRGQREK
jgi:hypothetical protein